MYPIANTLKTLMDADNPDMFGEKLSGLIRQMDHGDIRDNRNSRDIHDTFAAKELRSMFPESMIRENSRLPATAHASASASASQAGSASSPAPAPPLAPAPALEPEPEPEPVRGPAQSPAHTP
jgi:hypothetical protein